MTKTDSKLIESLQVHWTYLATFFCTLVDCGGLYWKYIEAISIFLVTKWIIIKMAMVTILKKIRVVEIKFSSMAAIIENLVM